MLRHQRDELVEPLLAPSSSPSFNPFYPETDRLRVRSASCTADSAALSASATCVFTGLEAMISANFNRAGTYVDSWSAPCQIIHAAHSPRPPGRQWLAGAALRHRLAGAGWHLDIRGWPRHLVFSRRGFPLGNERRIPLLRRLPAEESVSPAERTTYPPTRSGLSMQLPNLEQSRPPVGQRLYRPSYASTSRRRAVIRPSPASSPAGQPKTVPVHPRFP